jgi:VanZ family protein
MHLFAYLIFGLTLIYGIYKSVNLSSIKEFLILFSCGSVYAITDEIHQYFVPGRTCDIFDILADITGIVLSYFIFYLLNIIIITIKAKFV